MQSEDKSANDGTDIDVSPETRVSALVHAQMYAVGEKYIAPGLKRFAASQFVETVQHLNNAHLALVTEYVYKSTYDQDRGLRDIVLQLVTTKIVSLMQDADFCSIAINIPRFGFEFLVSTVRKVEKQNAFTYQIGECSHCPPRESCPTLYCRHNRAAEQFPII